MDGIYEIVEPCDVDLRGGNESPFACCWRARPGANIQSRKGRFVANQPSNLVQQALLTSLATNPEALVEFMKDPDRVLDDFGITDPTTRVHIRSLLALEVAKKLLVVPTALFIHK
jgi:hypothetical protein